MNRHGELALFRRCAVRLRDLGGHGPSTSPLTTTAEAERAVRCRGLDSLPGVDDQGSAPGVLALAR
ncbi:MULTISPECIES: hypothetical protein [unclassified Streptomyces]|uniref:hypothetical protein n=1 Tax=unclassified Streptomyces TaxID=2593676 RepID=UPI002E367101|nr:MULTISPECIES: hypothetical protein [unclassified Streptomyces]WUC68933.1 hypothetical protein OG861_16640 [Streptomyces sp. NBC_00539]